MDSREQSTHFRSATSADADGIWQLYATKGSENQSQKQLSKEGIKAMLLDESKGPVFVGSDGSEVIVAVFIYPEWSELVNAFNWWIKSVFVTDEANTLENLQRLFNVIHSDSKKKNVRYLRIWENEESTVFLQTCIKNGMTSSYVVFEEQISDLKNS